jgi:hypothetical protein
VNVVQALIAVLTAWFTTLPTPAAAPPPPPAPPAGIAGQFVEFARGARASAFAEQVSLLVQGTPIQVLRGDEVRERRHWSVCPPSWTPGPRCAVSPLTVVDGDRRNGIRTVVTEGDPVGPCLIAEVALPTWLEGMDQTVLQPGQELQSCAYNYAVRLFLDRGRIVAVDLVLNEP